MDATASAGSANRTGQTAGNDSELCTATVRLLRTPGLELLIVLEIVVGAAACVPNILLLVIVWRVKLFHVNLRILLGHLTLILLWYSGAFVVKASWQAASVLAGDVCRMAMRAYQCKLRELPVSIPNYAMPYASLIMCLERAYSTFFFRTSGRHGDNPLLAVFLLLLCASGVLSQQLVAVAHIPLDQTVPFCENLLSANQQSTVVALSVSLTVELTVFGLSLLTYLCGLRQSRWAVDNRAALDLTAKFQLVQNKQINRLMLRSMLFETCCFAPYLILLLLLERGVLLSPNVRLLMVHLSYNWKLLFAFANPVLAFVFNRNLQKHLRKFLPRRFVSAFYGNTVAPTPDNERHFSPVLMANAHFDAAAKLWRSPMRD